MGCGCFLYPFILKKYMRVAVKKYVLAFLDEVDGNRAKIELSVDSIGIMKHWSV